MIEALQGFPPKVLAFACRDHVTKQDYETVLIPAVEHALKQSGKLRFYYEISPTVSRIDAGAMWDDFKVGMEHILRWERVAVVTDVDWIRHTLGFFSFMIPAKVQLFHGNETAQARDWIGEGM